MGIDSTFQSFVRSEVKTSRGFRLVEAYLTHKNYADKHSGEYADYEVIEETKDNRHTNATTFTADPDFTFNSNFKDMPDSWVNLKQEEVSMQLAMVSKTSPLIEKRQQTYQTLSKFKPKGQHLDFKL
ncbi:MAG: hypothetical protein JJ953_12340 [Gracilimonas sp.]|uniref:hypothetical protein n=1 Tax=Gracilimonas TaxID=649462 RepID=UPI001B256760|nr:hypothetical protein [Gracilimonas sp.]MBO6586888.1 hypothetical protein [Gracilimonas sp.]MBO6614624.1 hypothetical protein [Gracilimonas sp.]